MFKKPQDCNLNCILDDFGKYQNTPCYCRMYEVQTGIKLGD